MWLHGRSGQQCTGEAVVGSRCRSGRGARRHRTRSASDRALMFADFPSSGVREIIPHHSRKGESGMGVTLESAKLMTGFAARTPSPSCSRRRLVHSMGYRFRLYLLPNCPDIRTWFSQLKHKITYVRRCLASSRCTSRWFRRTRRLLASQSAPPATATAEHC